MDWIKDIENYEPYNEQEIKDKDLILKCIKLHDDILTRENTIAHITSSGYIVNKSRTKVLMIYHNIYKSWSWTGGHADGDSNLLHVAIKEAKEETGLKNVTSITENITVRDNMIVLFAIKLEDKANLIFACSKNIKNISMNNLLKDSITLIDGRGGGSNFLAQGGGKNSSNLEGTMEYALRKINTL